jgi:hypothetical protein
VNTHDMSARWHVGITTAQLPYGTSAHARTGKAAERSLQKLG